MRVKNILLIATGLGTAWAVPATAQDNQSVPASPEVSNDATDAPAGEGEIIVTARKRQESILQVPVVETVLSQEQLQRRQVQDISDVSSLAPGLVLGLATVETGTQISIRGVGSTALDPGIDQSTSLNIDGLQLSQGSAYSAGIFDMAQIEVLKGPQALFFGKSSPAGVISIRSADPGHEFEVLGRLGYEAEAKEWRTEAVISGPVTDTLGLRVAALYADYGGYLRNKGVGLAQYGSVDPADRAGQAKRLYLRGTAVFKPSTNFNARLKLNYTRDRAQDANTQQQVGCPDGLGNYTGIPFFSPNENCKQDREFSIVRMDPSAYVGLRNGGVPFTYIYQKFGTLELNYDIVPALSLTSVTGYYDLHVETMINGTNTGAAGPPLFADKSFRRKEFTQELRLNSDFSGPLNFTLGGFYQDGKVTNDILIGGNLLLSRPPIVATGTHRIDIESISIFGQLRYKIVSDLEVAGGVRWTHEKRTDTANTLVGANFQSIPVPEINSMNWSPELTLTYTPSNDLTLFASLKQGYKSGSYNIVQPIFPGTNNSFGDEKVQGGEAGIKARLADRQIFTNLAFYYYKYKGLQVGAFETGVGGLPVIRTLNAGSIKAYGVDFDMNYKPRSVPGLEVRSAVIWNIAKFVTFDNAPCWGGQTISEGCNLILDPRTGRFSAQDLSGAPLPRAPKWQINAGVAYEMPLSNDMAVAFGVDGQYSSKYLGLLGRRQDFYQKGFAKLNADVTLKARDDAWELAFIGNNLTNRLTFGQCTSANAAGGGVFPGIITGGPVKGPAGSDEVACTVGGARELWVRLTVRPTSLFGGGESAPRVQAAPPPPPSQTCPDGSVLPAESLCPPPPAPPADTGLKAGERG